MNRKTSRALFAYWRQLRYVLFTMKPDKLLLLGLALFTIVCLLAVAYLIFGPESLVLIANIDTLLLFNVLLCFGGFMLCSQNQERRFVRYIFGGAAFQLLTEVLILCQMLGFYSGSQILSAVAAYHIRGNYLVGLGVLIFSFLFYWIVFIKLFWRKNKNAYPTFRLNFYVTLLTSLFTLIVIPLIFLVVTFDRDVPPVEGMKTALFSLVGFGPVFLRLDILRMLAISAFAHRYKIDDLQEAEAKKGRRWNGYAFLFGIRWCFYKGLIRPGMFLLASYFFLMFFGTAFLPGFFAVFFLTRIYCGLRGNHDYYRLKMQLNST